MLDNVTSRTSLQMIYSTNKKCKNAAYVSVVDSSNLISGTVPDQCDIGETGIPGTKSSKSLH